jgi:O-antigen/teichoic acid export membrane protein
LGRWVLLGNLSNLIPGPLFAWNFNYWVGRELVGVNYALTNLLRLVNPLSFTIGTLVMPHAARAREEGGIERAKQVMRRFGMLGTAALVPYLGLLILFPAHAIKLVYWHAGPELLQYTFALQIFAFGAALTYGSIVTGVFLNAVEHSRWTFLAQVLNAGVILFVAMPLTAMYDVIGAAVGILIASAIHLAAHLYYIRKLSAAGEGASMRIMRVEPAVQ